MSTKNIRHPIRLHRVIKIALTVASLSGAAWLAPAFAAPATDVPVDSSQDQAHESWRQTIKHISPPAAGCFHASYPSMAWEKVVCGPTSPLPRRLPASITRTLSAKATDGLSPAAPSVAASMDGSTTRATGAGNDYVLQVPGLISETEGSFSAVSGVKSVSSVYAYYTTYNILPNSYSLQLNTNQKASTAACGNQPGCTIWEQFTYGTGSYYDTNSAGQGPGSVSIEFFLLFSPDSNKNTDGQTCPQGWQYASELNLSFCAYQTAGTLAPAIPISQLQSVQLDGIAVAGGLDSAILFYGDEAYTSSASDSLLDLATVWNASEFNVFGFDGGSQATFNPGSSISVNIGAITNQANVTPTCVANEGTTGETNNLTLGKCDAASQPIPNIRFTESN